MVSEFEITVTQWRSLERAENVSVFRLRGQNQGRRMERQTDYNSEERPPNSRNVRR